MPTSLACPHCFSPNYLVQVTNSQQITPITSAFWHCENCQTNFAVNVGLGAASSPATTGSSAVQKTAVVTTAGPVSFAGVRLIGIENLHTAAQTVTGKIFDNPSAAAGTVLEDIPALVVGVPVTYPGNGKIISSGGFTVSLTGIPLGDGIAIIYH